MNKVLSAYQNLLLEPGVDLSTIEKRYKFMTRGLHPDQHSSTENKARAEATMKTLNAAVETLRKHFKTDHKDNGPCDCRPSAATGDPNASEQTDSDKAKQEEEFAARRNEERQNAQQNSTQEPSEEQIRTAFQQTAYDWARKRADKVNRIKVSIAAFFALIALYAGAYWKANLKSGPLQFSGHSTSSSKEPMGQRPFLPPPASSSGEQVNLIDQVARRSFAEDVDEKDKALLNSLEILAKHSNTEIYNDESLLNLGMYQDLLDRVETRFETRKPSEPWLAKPTRSKGVAKDTLDPNALKRCTDLLSRKQYLALWFELIDHKKTSRQALSEELKEKFNKSNSALVPNLRSLSQPDSGQDNQGSSERPQATNSSNYSYSPGSPYSKPVIIPGVAPAVQKNSGGSGSFLDELNTSLRSKTGFNYLDKGDDTQLVNYIKKLSQLDSLFLFEQFQRVKNVPSLSDVTDETIRLRFIYTDLSTALALKEPDEQQRFTYFSQASKCMQYLFSNGNSPLLSMAYARNNLIQKLRYSQ